jgi:hypothetical protein
MIDYGVSEDLFKGTRITVILSRFQDGVLPEWIEPQKVNFSFET